MKYKNSLKRTRNKRAGSKKKEEQRKDDKEIEKELVALYIDEEMERALQDGVRTGRRVSKLNNQDAVKRYRKTLTEKIRQLMTCLKTFLMKIENCERKSEDKIKKKQINKKERKGDKEIKRRSH